MAPWGSVQPRGAMPRGGSCSHSCSCTRPARRAVSYAVRSELSRRGASRRERDLRGVGPQDHPSPSASTAATGRNRSRVYAPGGAPSAFGWTVSRPTRILPSRLDVFAGGADPFQAPSASVSKERPGRPPPAAPSLGLVVRALLSNGAAVSRRRRLHKRWRVMRRTRSRLRRNLTDPHWARPHRLQARGRAGSRTQAASPSSVPLKTWLYYARRQVRQPRHR